MPKKKERSSEEFWRGKCRELEKQVRQLQKVLSYYEKRDRSFEEKSQDEEIIKDSEDTKPILLFRVLCPICEKNYMVETLNLGSRGIYGTCVCGNKGRIK